MVKRICPACGKKHFTVAQQKTFICSCGTELAPDLNKGIGESEVNSLAHFPVVGQVLDNGRKVLANYMNKFILAVKEDLDSPEPYNTWFLDQDGEPYGGHYFVNAESAERNFAELCFSWFENMEIKIIAPAVDMEPSSTCVLIDMNRMSEDAAANLDKRRILEFSGSPEEIKEAYSTLKNVP